MTRAHARWGLFIAAVPGDPRFLLAVKRMEEANGWWVTKSREPPSLAYPPVIRFAQVSPPRAAPEFLLCWQVDDHIAVLINKVRRDAEAVLRPTAMLTNRRSVVRVALNPVGIVMRETGYREQDARSHDDYGDPASHLALPAGGYATHQPLVHTRN